MYVDPEHHHTTSSKFDQNKQSSTMRVLAKGSFQNDETYGIFHMFFYCLKMIFEQPVLLHSAQLVSLHLGGKQTKSFQFTQPNLWTIPYVRGWLRELGVGGGVCVYIMGKKCQKWKMTPPQHMEFSIYFVVFFLKLPLMKTREDGDYMETWRRGE